jgi:hypothetical protein
MTDSSSFDELGDPHLVAGVLCFVLGGFDGLASLSERESLRLVCKRWNGIVCSYTEKMVIHDSKIIYLKRHVKAALSRFVQLKQLVISAGVITSVELVGEPVLQQLITPDGGQYELIAKNRNRISTDVTINVLSCYTTHCGDSCLANDRIVSAINNVFAACGCLHRSACNFLQIIHLDVSSTCITDSGISHVLCLLTQLNVLRANNCNNLISPLDNFIAARTPQLNQVFFEGCFRIETSEILRISKISTLMIDIVNDTPLEKFDELEVVILSEPFTGCWTRCSILQSQTHNTDESLKAKYDILVWETLKFNHAVGFSGRIANNISRIHLRRITKHFVPHQKT